MKKNTHNQLPFKELESVGLVEEGTLTMEWNNVNALKLGHMTNLVELKNLKNEDGSKINSLDARISVVTDENNGTKLRIDPIYKKVKKHSLLSEEEHDQLVKEKIANIKKKVLDKNGNETYEIIEFDKQTNQFISYDPRKVIAPESINDEPLTLEKKRKFKAGETVSLDDGIMVQYSTSDRSGLRSNRPVLVLSILLDGGVSYLLITGISQLFGKSSLQKQSYSKGYIQALKKVEEQLERKQRKFPNDKLIAQDINIVKQELYKASNLSEQKLDSLKSKDSDDVKNHLNINDPDLCIKSNHNRRK